jgi:hypothetical protein
MRAHTFSSLFLPLLFCSCWPAAPAAAAATTDDQPRIGADHAGNLVLVSSNATMFFGGPVLIPSANGPDSGQGYPPVNIAAELSALRALVLESRAEITGVKSELAATRVALNATQEELDLARGQLGASTNMTLGLYESVREDLASVRHQVTEVTLLKTCADVYTGSFFASNWTLTGGPVMFSEQFAARYGGYCGILGSVEVIGNSTLTSMNMSSYLWTVIKGDLRIIENRALTYIALPGQLQLITGYFGVVSHPVLATLLFPSLSLQVNAISISIETNTVLPILEFPNVIARRTSITHSRIKDIVFPPLLPESSVNLQYTFGMTRVSFASATHMDSIGIFNNQDLISITLPNGLAVISNGISIGSNPSLQSIVFPATLQAISGYFSIYKNHALSSFIVHAPSVNVFQVPFDYCQNGNAVRPSNIIASEYSCSACQGAC